MASSAQLAFFVIVTSFYGPRELQEHEVLLSRNVYFDKQYLSIVTLERLEKTPRWNLHQDENPRLSAGKAISIGRKMLKDKLRFLDSETEKWVTSSASLISYDPAIYPDLWVWSIKFRQQITAGGASSGPPQYIEAIVLMDGEAIVPEVFDYDSDR